jgi:hypothetical protein
MSDQRQRLLVNYWYANPVGHAIEGLRYALGHHAANPELRVSLLLNAATPTELAGCCPFLDDVFTVPYTSFVRAEGDPAAALVGVPRFWDYVVENHRVRDAAHDAFAGFRAFFDAAERHFEPRFGFGVVGHAPPGYRRHQELRLALPDDAREAARRTIGPDRRAISVVLAGSAAGRHLYPSAKSWKLILTELSVRYPDAALCLIGKRGADGRTTSRVGRSEVALLLAAVPASIDCFDRPILEQIALVEASDLLVAPHTGFAFTASTVGTPWLAISGGNWHEYFFNGVPVYSLVPDTTRYPCFAWAERGSTPLPVLDPDDDGEGPRTPSMSAARIREDLPELLHAAALLIERRLPYEEALATYFPRLLTAYHGDRSRVFSFDDIHRGYLP